jgi:hypothetical protein
MVHAKNILCFCKNLYYRVTHRGNFSNPFFGRITTFGSLLIFRE